MEFPQFVKNRGVEFGSKLVPFFQIVLGKVVQNPAKLDQDLVAELIEMGQGLPFHTVSGKTVCTNDFYEGTFHFVNGYMHFKIGHSENKKPLFSHQVKLDLMEHFVHIPKTRN